MGKYYILLFSFKENDRNLNINKPYYKKNPKKTLICQGSSGDVCNIKFDRDDY